MPVHRSREPGIRAMRWQSKAAIQNICSRLPAGNDLYYALQRRFGTFGRPPAPMELLRVSAQFASELAAAGHPISGARVMEVGTGRRIDIPLGFYLAGAAGVVTVDLNRYLRPELVMASIRAMHACTGDILAVFGELAPRDAVHRRLERLLGCKTLPDVLSATNITYLAPVDAQRTNIASGSIDIHMSYTVFEHIPRAVLVNILKEASRLLDEHGSALHHVDLSDHFAHDDPSISYINFLKFSQNAWNRIAGNRFGYHNRLRAADYRGIYSEAGHEIKKWTEFRDERSLKVLQGGFAIDGAYQGTSAQDLAISVVRILSR